MLVNETLDLAVLALKTDVPLRGAFRLGVAAAVAIVVWPLSLLLWWYLRRAKPGAAPAALHAPASGTREGGSSAAV